jgi:predicted transcriptional regulator
MSSIIQALMVIGFVILQQIMLEAVGWYFIYRHEEFKDLSERAQNLSKKLSELKSQLLFG